MRGLKIAAYVVGGLVALLAVLLVGVVLFVDPNDYRHDIERLVQRQTGRELKLEGKLKLSVFPWLALETGPATLGDAAGFGPEPFASIREARVGVRLWPLLAGRIEVGNVRLDGARIRLVTDAQGRDNWADLAGGGEERQAAAESARPAQLPTVAGLEIRDAAVTVENLKEKTRRAVRDFNLETGRLASGEPFDFKTDFVLDQEPISAKVHLAARVTADLERNAHRLADPEIDVTLSGQGYPRDGVAVKVRAGSLTADIGQKLYRLEGLGVTTTWKGDGVPQAGIPIALKAPDFSADLAAQTLELKGLDLDVAGARLSGALSGARILDAPRLQGSLKLDPVELRD